MQKIDKLEMWVNAQRDGRAAEYRWRPLFNDDEWCCRLRQVDVELMKTLQDRVNLVPVIAKSDTLTKCEVATLKSRVRLNFTQRRRQEFLSLSLIHI